MSDRFRDVLEKIGAEIVNLELDRNPAASDVIVSPLGSPTAIPTSGRMLSRKFESDSLKMVLVAPQSCIGVCELERVPTAADVMLLPLGSPTVIPTSGRILSKKVEIGSLKIEIFSALSWTGVFELAICTIGL